MAKFSIKEETAKALSVEPALIPERLRNRLNGYLRNDTIPKAMIGEAPTTSESHNYTPKPIKQGNQTYLRNIVFLDTLFDDPKVVKSLILNDYEKDERNQCLQDFQQLNIAKLDLLKSMLPMQESILNFLQRDDIDWNTEEIPYPYTEGRYASPLIAANLNQSHDLSIYDQALKHFLNKDYRQALNLIESHQDQFISSDTSLLRVLIEHKYAEYKEYAEYLANFS